MNRTPKLRATERSGVASGDVVRRLHPTRRWRRLPGPPCDEGRSPVWEDDRGVRIHAGGMICRLPDGTIKTASFAVERHYSAHQPVPRRWLMVWAEQMTPPNAGAEGRREPLPTKPGA